MPMTAAASPPVPFVAAPESAESPEPESQPEPEPNPTLHHDRALKRKLREAVAVANRCYRALERERAEADDEIRRLRLHLLLEGNALKKSRENPTGARLGPTREEAQAFVAEKERKKREAERRRQCCIEDALKRDLESRHNVEMLMQQRERERLQRLPKFGPKTKSDTEYMNKIYRNAFAIAQSHGRNCSSLADLREAAGNPRLVSALQTRPAARPSPEHCTGSSSGPG